MSSVEIPDMGEVMKVCLEYMRDKGVCSVPDFCFPDWDLLLLQTKKKHPYFCALIGKFDNAEHPVNRRLREVIPALHMLYMPTPRLRILLNGPGANPRPLEVSEDRRLQVLAKIIFRRAQEMPGFFF